MAGVNKVILIGNLGADPEFRALENGSTVSTFNIATTENYTLKSGERVEQTEWHHIELWGRLAEIAHQYLKKGSQVYIEGRLRTDSWTDKEGNTKSRVIIRGNTMNMLGGPASARQDSVMPEKPGSFPENQPVPPPFATQNDDDLPF